MQQTDDFARLVAELDTDTLAALRDTAKRHEPGLRHRLAGEIEFEAKRLLAAAPRIAYRL